MLLAIGEQTGRKCDDCVPTWIFVPCLRVANLAVGSILGVLDQRARASR